MFITVDGKINARKENYAALLDTLPEVRELSPVLYIGASPRSANHFLDGLRNWLLDVDVLEPWLAYCEWLETLLWPRQIIQGDIRSIDLPSKSYATALWCQGPEHVQRDELSVAMANCERFVTKYVIAFCPWGMWPQPAGKDNCPFQVHKATLYPEDFEAMSYNVLAHRYTKSAPEKCTLGKDAIGQLMAWKKM